MSCMVCHKLLCKCSPPIIINRDWETQFNLVVAEKDSLEEQVSMLTATLQSRNTLLESCEKALEETQQQVAALKVELAEMEQLYGSEFNLNNNLIAVRAALKKERDEAVSAVQRLSEGQPFDQVVAADIVRRGMEQLAASQLREQKLREAMVIALGHYSMRTNSASVLENALALPADDTALQARLAEEREKCAVKCEQHGQTLGSILAAEIRSMT